MRALESVTITSLFTTITEVITNIMTLFSKVSETLLGNTIFQFVIGIIVLGIVIRLICNIFIQLKLDNGMYSISDVKIKGKGNYRIRGKRITEKEFDNLFYSAEEDSLFDDHY